VVVREAIQCVDLKFRLHGSLSFDEGAHPNESAWDVLSRLIGTVEGPADWASEIDHYLYGTPNKTIILSTH
jgi:hypothetical protein